jgi:hypothetical protein
MIRINNSTIDLIIQVEEHTAIKKIFDRLTLDINDVLIICPELFFQRFIQSNHEEIPVSTIDSIEHMTSLDYIRFNMRYKGKEFNFHFIFYSTETKVVNNPFKGEQEFKVGFKVIKIN